ncbi:MAG: DUF11 domain-containing protein [Bacteroidetes bacterium]|nr:DUF11 domain-containing protein [Bacteroidota bacterium]
MTLTIWRSRAVVAQKVIALAYVFLQFAVISDSEAAVYPIADRSSEDCAMCSSVPFPDLFSGDNIPHSWGDPLCYLVADNKGFMNSDDVITFVDEAFDETALGKTGTKHMEAIAFDPNTGILYGADADRLGSIDLTTGAFTEIGPFGSGDGVIGVLSFNDIDGLTFDPFSGIMYASVRRSGIDKLIQVDLATGAAIVDAFGPGLTYVPIPPINNLDDIDDIAVSSVDGTMYAIMNENGKMSRLITIDKTTGVSTDVTDLDVENVEGLGFHPDGRFLGVLGNGGQKLLEIDPSDGTTTVVAYLGINGNKDYEGVACLTEEQNRIEGSVLLKKKIDLELEKSATGPQPNLDVAYVLSLLFNATPHATAPNPNSGVPGVGIKVNLFADNNEDGVLDGGDSFLASTLTDGAGGYAFDISAVGHFVVLVDLATVPFLAVLPLDHQETAVFVGFGETDTGNDFVFFSFTDATGIIVSDLLPSGVTFVSSSATHGSYHPNTGFWTVGGLSPGDHAELTINVTQQGLTQENCAEVKRADPDDLDSTPHNGDPQEDDYDCVTTERDPEIDLELEKSVDDPMPESSESVDYLLRVTNSNSANSIATGVIAVDYLPSDVTFVETIPVGGIFDAASKTVTWEIGGLGIGESVEIIIRILAPSSGTHRNCAEIFEANEGDVDSEPGNGVDNAEDDQDCASFTVQEPVLGEIGDRVFNDLNSNGLEDPGDPGLPGVLLRLYEGACGPTGAPLAAQVSDPTGAYLFTDLPAGLYCVDPVDSSIPFGFVLTTANDPMTVDLGAGELFLDADFGYVAQPELFEADLDLTKTVSSSSPALNEIVTFTITLSNKGPADATNVTVRDVIPVGLVYIDAQPSQGSFDTQNGFWGIGELPVDASVELKIRVQVVIQNMIENIAQVIFVDQHDPDSTPSNGIPSEDDQDNAIIEARGPGGVGDIIRVECTDVGTINALAYDPVRDLIIAGSEGGRIHVSTDSGMNWPPFLETSGKAPIRDIVISASGSAYAGTFGDGAYASFDGGTNWASIGPPTETINDLDIDDATETVFAAAFGRISVFDGVVWSDLGAATSPFGGRQVLSVAFDAATGDVFAAAEGIGVNRHSSGVWTAVNSGLPTGKVNVLFSGPGYELLAGTNNDGVFVFTGGTWARFGAGLNNEPIESLGSGPNGELLAGARESAAYFFNFITDTWLSIGTLPIYTVTSITANAIGEVYAGAPGEGIYRIEDTDFDGIPDLAHQVANFLTTAVIQDLVVTPSGELFAATYGYGVLFSNDGGKCWTRLNRGLENLWVFAIARRHDGVLFIGVWADSKGGIWRSDDDGRNWEFVAFANRQIVSLAIDPNDDDIMYAGVNLSGTGSIYRTLDGGQTWTVLESFTEPVWSIAISPFDAQRVVIGTLGDGVWESTDGGASFAQIGSPANGLQNDAVFELAFAPLGSSYAGEPFAGTGAGVYQFDAITETWSLFGAGSQGHEIRVLAFVGPNIFAGTWSAGVLKYDPGTDTWEEFVLPYIPVVAFVVHPGTETLVIGTWGHGLYLAPNVVVSTDIDQPFVENDLPGSFELRQNYPNPFNPSTTVPFEIHATGHYRVSVFDLLGREIGVLLDQVLPAGSYSVTWEAGNRPSGTYMIRMASDGRMVSRVVALLK